MRHISLDQIYVPEEWEDHTQELINRLRPMPHVQRTKTLRDDTDYQVWTLLSRVLKGISHGKCFYTEAYVGNGGEIDHFRPKSRVQKCDLHQRDLDPNNRHLGYWSLAYLIGNFRLCRELANKRRKDSRDGKTYGKGTRFPLIDPSKRAPSDTDEWKKEPNLLLDPTNEDDVKLLRFDDRGNPVALNPDKTSVEYMRVQASIECYHLNEKEISDRRGDLCTKAKTMARRIVDLEKKKANGESYVRREMIEKKAELHEMVQPYAEFSSAVRCVLMQFRTSPSIKRILGI